MVDRIAKKPDYSQGIWAESGSLYSPSSDKIQTGHVVEKPPYQTANWIENRQDNGILYLMQNGLSSWTGDLFYPQYAIITKNGIVYQALQQSTGQDPTTKTDYWIKAFYSHTDGSKLADFVNNILNTEGYLDLYVSKASPVMNSVAKGVGYADSTGKDGLFFEDDGAVLKDDGNIIARVKPVEDLTESSDKIVTMAVLQKALLKLQAFPVGSIYTTISTKNPFNLLGYGEWERFGGGRCLVGVSTNGDDPNWVRSIEETFGEYSHKLTEGEVPTHDHTVGDGVFNNFSAIAQDVINKYSYKGNGKGLTTDGEDNIETSSQIMVAGITDPYREYSKVREFGGSQPHNNVQPSITVSFWKRVS